MSEASFKFEKANRSLMERLFEPPTVGKMSPVANIVAYFLLAIWSVFVLFPLYWVVITSFKDAAAVNQGPFYIPFVDFQPNLNAWRAQFNTDPFCDLPSILRQVGLLLHNSLHSWCRPWWRSSRWSRRFARSILPSQIPSW
jgi:multiple sugar transport system permease protein